MKKFYIDCEIQKQDCETALNEIEKFVKLHGNNESMQNFKNAKQTILEVIKTGEDNEKTGIN